MISQPGPPGIPPTMDALAWVSLCASIIWLALGIVVYYFNRKSILNKLFFLMILAGFFYSFTTVMMWMSHNFESSFFWHKMGTMLPFFVVLVLNFALVFTDNSWIKNKRNYLVLYLPAVLFWLIDLFTNQINMPPVVQYWGYNDLAAGTVVYIISTIWTVALSILAFVLCFRHYRRAKDNLQRQRRKLVMIGFGISIATLATNMLARSFNMPIPNLWSISTLFFSVFVGYAIVKYDLFTFDVALAAENILSTMPDSLILANMKTKMLRVNERLVDFTGYAEEELVGQPIIKLCAENENSYYSALKELVEKRVTRGRELVFKTKSGEKRNILFSGSVVENRKGVPIGLTCVIHDVTERKKMEERLVKAERLASIGELAGQIGHDLRNPLSGIKNAVYILKKKSERLTEAEKKEIFGIIDVAIEDSNRIITSLVDYSSELNLQLEPCTPKSLVLNALSKIQVPERISIQNNTSDDIEMLLDMVRVESVFASIIKNAIDASPEKAVIQIRSILKGSNVEISFIDSGTGIPEDVLPKIFSPLVTTKAKGMGMSLAICKRVVEAHDGKVAVESTVGKGTTVTITLPIKPSKTEFAQDQLLEV
jgi:PAS domain S-box-containing protein